jgi:hypothetical protein
MEEVKLLDEEISSLEKVLAESEKAGGEYWAEEDVDPEAEVQDPWDLLLVVKEKLKRIRCPRAKKQRKLNDFCVAMRELDEAVKENRRRHWPLHSWLNGTMEWLWAPGMQVLVIFILIQYLIGFASIYCCPDISPPQ